MNAEDLVVDNCRDGQAVEDHVEGLPQLERVALLALVIKPIDPAGGRGKGGGQARLDRALCWTRKEGGVEGGRNLLIEEHS